MILLPRHLQELFKKKSKKKGRRFHAEVDAPRLVETDGRTVQDFDVYPEDPAVRKTWFSLTFREREIIALVCMGYRNYEAADYLGVEYATVQTHLQNIFRKFGLRSRGKIRQALLSWAADEWWTNHH